MKQFITPKQLKTLTETEKNRLREWWKPKRADSVLTGWHKKAEVGFIVYENATGYFVDARISCGYLKKEDILPLLSIGQMIEFLDEHNGNIWGALIDGYDDFFKPVDQWCDVLWEAVRETLKK